MRMQLPSATSSTWWVASRCRPTTSEHRLWGGLVLSCCTWFPPPICTVLACCPALLPVGCN